MSAQFSHFFEDGKPPGESMRVVVQKFVDGELVASRNAEWASISAQLGVSEIADSHRVWDLIGDPLECDGGS